MKLGSKVLVIALCLMMLLSACGSNPGTSPATSTAAGTTAADNSASSTAASTSNNPQVVTLVRYASSYVQGQLDKVGETWEKNRWNDVIAKELGYQIQYKWIVSDQDSYNQKFNAMVATGDLPDVVSLNNIQLKQCVDAGLLADITSAYNDLASPLTKQLITSNGTSPLDAATFDGKLYGLPLVDADIEQSTLLWVRTDWLKQAGLELPKTMDDVTKVAQAFKKIAGAGAVPLVIQNNLYPMCTDFTINGFMNGYGAYPGMWIPQNGKAVYGNTTPEFKTALLKLADMYKAGLLDKEFSTKDASKVAADIISGKNGLFYAIHAAPLWPLQDAVNNDPKADWTGIPLPNVDGTGATPGVQLATTSWYCSSKNSKVPESVVKLMNLYDDLYFDPQKQQYKNYAAPQDGVDGLWAVSPVTQYGANKNGDIAKEIAPNLVSGDPGNLFGEALAMFQFALKGQNGDRANWGWYKINGKGGAKEVQNQYYVSQNRMMPNVFFGAPTATMSSKWTILESAMEENMTKTIMGQMSASDWDKAVKAWFDGGGQQITDEVNAWYQTQPKK